MPVFVRLSVSRCVLFGSASNSWENFSSEIVCAKKRDQYNCTQKYAYCLQWMLQSLFCVWGFIIKTAICEDLKKKLQLPSQTFKNQYKVFKRTNNCDCTIFYTNVPHDISYIYKHLAFSSFPPATSYLHTYQYNKQAASPSHTLWLKLLCASLTFSMHTTCCTHPVLLDHLNNLNICWRSSWLCRSFPALLLCSYYF